MSITAFCEAPEMLAGDSIGMGRFDSQIRGGKANFHRISQPPEEGERGWSKPTATDDASQGGSIMSRRRIGRMPRWMAAGVLAGVLLGAGGLAPKTADAQTVTTFLSNTGLSGTSNQTIGNAGLGRNAGLSQAFRTGMASNTYNLTRIVIRSGGTAPWIRHLAAEVQTDDGGNPSGTVHATLSVPSNDPGSDPVNVNFDVDGSPVELSNNTTYHIVLRYTGTAVDPTIHRSFRWQQYRGNLAAGNTHPVDSGGTSGWSIPSHAKRLSGGNWSTVGGAALSKLVKFQVVGTDGAATATLPEVTVSPKAASVVGGTGRPGVFVLSRTGPTTADLVVDFTMTGDGSAYSNFSTRPDMATIPMGSMTHEVSVPSSQQEAGDSLPMILTIDEAAGRYTRGMPFEATVTVTGPVDRSATGTPLIEGMAQVGVTLMVDTSGIMDPDDASPTFAFEWDRETSPGVWEDIGAQRQTNGYTLDAADLGRRIRVVVVVSDSSGGSTRLTSAPTAAVAAAAQAPDAGNALISNTGQTAGGGRSILATGSLSQPFATGMATNGEYRVTRIVIASQNMISAAQRTAMTAEIRSTSGLNPGSRLASLTIPDTVTSSTGNHNFDVAGGSVTLANNTTYHIVLHNSHATDEGLSWRWVNAGTLDSGSATGWSASRARIQLLAANPWSGLSIGSNIMPRFLFQVIGTDVAPPAPSFISNVEQAVQALDTRVTSQAFTAGSETTGYTLGSVDLHIGVVGTVAGWAVTIRDNASGDVPAATALYTLAAPASMTANAINTFTAPPNATLDAGTKYHIVIDPPNTGSYGRTLISNGLDGTAAAGWDFPEGQRANRSGSWTAPSTDRRQMVRIRGTVGATAVSRVTIDGTPKVDVVLTANTGRIIDPHPTNPNYSYQWERADDAAGTTDVINVGMNSATYTPVKADERKFLRVTVSYTDDGNNAGTPVSSDWTSAVERRANSRGSGKLVIEGIARVGRLLTATVGTFNDPNGFDEDDFVYDWVRASDEGEDIHIPGAIFKTYRLTAADQGFRIYVIARSTDSDGYPILADSSSIPSDPNGTIAAQAPNTAASGDVTIDDGAAAEVGVQLSAVTTGITDANGLIDAPDWRYQWQSAADIVPANPTVTSVGTDSADYTPAAGDMGKYLRVVVTFTDDDGHEETKTSEWTMAVLAAGASPSTPATGDLTIDGGATVQVAVRLMADTSDIDDPVNGLTPPTAFTYQWQRADDTAGAGSTDVGTGVNYTPVGADETKYLRVVVTFMDDEGNDETKTSEWIGPVGAAPATPDTPATGDVTVANDPPPADGMTVVKVGVELTADTDGIADPANGLTTPNWRYQWRRADDASGTGAADITGATSETYTPVKADQDKFLRVVVRFTDDDGYPETEESAWTSAVAKRDDTAATGDVTIDGGAAAQVDVELSANTSAIDDPVNGLTTPNYRYQWQRADDNAGANAADISGATSDAYTPTKEDDQDKFLRVAVTFTDDDDYEETLMSDWTSAVAKRADADPVGAPAISGIVKVGEDLTADATAFSDANGTTGVTFAYQWQRQTAAGAWMDVGSDSTTYSLTAADVGMRIRVQVSYTDNDDYPETVDSDATAPITSAANTLATGAPAIVGVARVGRVLRATPGTVDDADGLATPGYAYQWQRGDPGAVIAWSDIANAASPTYSLTAADEGKKIRVKAAFTDDGGTLEERPSDAYPAGSAAVEPADAPADSGPRSVFTIESLSPSITEPSTGTVDVRFVVMLARSAAHAASSLAVDYRFTGSAREGRDFTHSGAQRLVFDAGVAERVITVTVNSDIIAEPNGETLVVALATPSGGASLGRNRSATVAISEPAAQIYVEATKPQYIREDKTVSFSISLSEAAPVPGLVEWRLVFDGAGAAGASPRSAEGRATVNCVVGRSCTGRAMFQTGSTDPTEDTSAVFDSDLPTGTVMRLQVRPFAAAPGSSLPSGTISAARPSPALSSSESETAAGGWINIGKETLVTPYPRGLVHTVAGVSRTVATSIVDGIWRRADARRAGGQESQATLGGKTLDTRALSSGDAGRAVREVASLLGLEAAAPDASLDGLHGGHGGGVDDYRAWAGIPDQNRLVSQSSFALSVGDWIGATGPITIWGEMSVTGSVSKPSDTSSVDSDSSEILLGFDLPIDDGALFGLAVSRSSGESEYRDSSADGEDGEAETSLMTFAPYVHWTNASGVSLWGSLGLGSGTLEMTIDGSDTETDVGMTMVAAGAKSPSTRIGRGEFALRGDFFNTAMDAEMMAGFGELSTKASRIRLAVEGAATWVKDSGAVTSNRMELGARLDSGDGEEGAGADVAVEIRYATPNGLEIKGRLSSLLLHQQDGFREWGAGLGFAYAPGIAGRGVSLSFEPTWNVPRSGVAESMWGSRDLDGYASSNAGAAMKARLGYSAGTLRDRALATLYGETESGDDSRRLRLGAEMRGLAGPLERLSLDVYGQREEGQSPRPSDSIMLEGSLGF